MIRRKLFAAPVMLVMLMLLVAGAASGDSILTSVNQIGQVVSPADNSGSFLISSMLGVDAQRAPETFPGSMPANTGFYRHLDQREFHRRRSQPQCYDHV